MRPLAVITTPIVDRLQKGFPMTVADRVKNLVADHLIISDRSKLIDGARFEDLGADSLDRVELAIALEEEFGVELSDDDLEQVVTLGDAIRLIERVTKGRVSA